jgi:hypothetical protein
MRGHGWWTHTTIIVAAVIIFMMISAAAASPWWEYAFLSDDSPVSWLSSALLFGNAAVALSLALARSLPRALGYGLAAALTTLSLDEQFKFHERLKASLHGGPAGDLPTWAVGVGGIAILVTLVRSAETEPRRALMAAAVVIGLFALWVDLGTPPAALARLEEAFEVLAESVFLCGLLEISRVHVQSVS